MKKQKTQVSKARYFVYYLTQCCFTFVPILLSIILLFQLTETSVTSGLNMALPQNQIKVVGFVLFLIVPVSVAIGWLFLKIWIFLAKPGMTPQEIRRFIQRGLGSQA